MLCFESAVRSTLRAQYVTIMRFEQGFTCEMRVCMKGTGHTPNLVVAIALLPVRRCFHRAFLAIWYWYALSPYNVQKATDC